MRSLGYPVNHDLPLETRKVRTLVADDYPSMQQALVQCLETMPDVQVVGTACNGKEALEKSAELKPDVLVADLLMPVMNGFELFGKMRELYPETRLIAVSGHYSPAIESEALAAGADAFIAKNGLPGDLISTLRKLISQ